MEGIVAISDPIGERRLITLMYQKRPSNPLRLLMKVIVYPMVIRLQIYTPLMSAPRSLPYGDPLSLPLPFRSFLNPRISPSIPGGLGTGHSLRSLLPLVWSSIIASSSVPTPSSCFIVVLPSVLNSSWGTHLRRLLPLFVPSSFISPSAYAILGAGQGRICGSPTTKKLARRVVANREEVYRDLGCKWGGMMNWIPQIGPARSILSKLAKLPIEFRATYLCLPACGERQHEV
jgi:hypothetical protein